MYKELELNSLKDMYEIDFLIVTATDIELETARTNLQPFDDEILVTHYDNNTYYCGIYGKYSCAIIRTNQMGAVLAGAALQTVGESIDALKPKAVIMGGIALGKNAEKQNIGDILISKSLILYEQARLNENNTIDYRGPKPEASRCLLNRMTQETKHNYQFDGNNKIACVQSGPILTGEKLIDNSTFKTALFKQFPDAIGGEMEGTGLYVACNERAIHWIIVKSICDWADGNKNKDFQTESAHIAFSFIAYQLNSEIAFKSIGIAPYLSKKKESPEIKIDARDILELLVSRRNFSELHKSKEEVRISARKIYYEYYHFEDRGRTEGFLFLGKHITITNTLEHLVENFDKPNILNIYVTKKHNNGSLVDRITHLTKEVKKRSLDNIIFDGIKYLDEMVRETTLKGLPEVPHQKRSDYIDQKVYPYNNKNEFIGNCTDYFIKKLTNNDDSCISIVFGSGGVGKTTFCEALRNEFDTTLKETRKRVLLIKGERTSKLSNYNELHIESLLDLFEAFKDECDFPLMMPVDFKLNYIFGNVVVIIDALDEIKNALGERFNLQGFFESLSTLDERFHNAKILLTTRETESDFISESTGITKYKLNGFTKGDIDKFIDIKLEKNSDKNKFYSFLESITNKQSNYSLPILINWACEAVLRTDNEEDIREITKSVYLLKSEVYDSVLIPLLYREIDKQSINADVDDIFKLLIEIVLEHQNKMPVSDLKEYVELEFNESIDRFLINPLLGSNVDHVSVKEDALCNLIKARQLRYLILNNPELISKIADLLKESFEGEGELFGFLVNSIDLQSELFYQKAKLLINKLVLQENKEEKVINKQKYRKSISALLYLMFNGKDNKNKTERSEEMIALFDVNVVSGILTNVHIFGSFFALDFRNVQFMNSTFNKYEKFDECIFPNPCKSVFSYCEFRNINLEKNTDINEHHFEGSCKFVDSNIQTKLKAQEEDRESFRNKIKDNIISIVKYIDTTQRSFNLIKKHTTVKWNQSHKGFLSILNNYDFLQIDNKGLYRVHESYYDDLPDLKIGKLGLKTGNLISTIALNYRN